MIGVEEIESVFDFVDIVFGDACFGVSGGVEFFGRRRWLWWRFFHPRYFIRPQAIKNKLIIFPLFANTQFSIPTHINKNDVPSRTLTDAFSSRLGFAPASSSTGSRCPSTPEFPSESRSSPSPLLSHLKTATNRSGSFSMSSSWFLYLPPPTTAN